MCGTIAESFNNNDYKQASKTMYDFCSQGKISELHKRGNCAHAMGHALMMMSDDDLEKSVKSCKEFPEEAMGYYCATGVFMEYADKVLQKLRSGQKVKRESLHHPCDKYTEYPAACYRYFAQFIAYDKRLNSDELKAECMKLDKPLRLGCFHGLGVTYSRKIAKKPDLVKSVCVGDSTEESTMCIEGVIEKLADYNEDLALQICTNLQGEYKKICDDAAIEKMYRLEKESLALYCN